jgi:hypothetical protein
MSAFGGKADIAPASQNVRLRPDMPVQERQQETDPGQRFRTGMLLICAGEQRNRHPDVASLFGPSLDTIDGALH